ncbi:hypothetical protein [uncultured Sphingomonas sp.]|uniref:hypothetical protein n=1 Tax=uncultured Sphingomonas sp. TaxID=158754 RepID=UPI0026239EC6|nr:hypothetical protein [uncultured Sphingomonas sp.]
MKTLFLIAATSIAAAIVAAVPAGARTVAQPPAAPATMPSTTPSPSPKQRICVVDTMIGTNVPTKVCHTRAQWSNLGIDPFAK